MTKSNYLSLSNIWWKSNSCGHAHLHYVYNHHTKLMEVCMPQDFDFLQIFSKWQVVGLSHFVRPSGYRYMVCPAISSYSFGATALIFCRMFIHIMEVDLFIISLGGVSRTNHVPFMQLVWKKWLSPTTCHFEKIWRKSKSCEHAHLHYVYKHPTKY
jgi:hypothetical protein